MGRLCVSATAGIVAFAVSGCTPQADGLFFTAPIAAATGAVQSSKAPAQVANALRAAGFSDVRINNAGTTISLRSDTGNMIDCGAITQLAFDNRATFAGSARRAAIVADQELYVRDVDVSSSAQVSLVSTGNYDISENHTVTVTYNSPTGSRISRETKMFDQSGSGSFLDGVVCVSAGAVAAVF